MNKNHKIFCGILLGLYTTFSFAGITDTPTSKFPDGSKAKHRYSVTGVISGKAGLQTVFICTNMEKKKTINVGIEIFDFHGGALNNIFLDNGVVVVPAGTTINITTGKVVAISPNEVINLFGEAFDAGSARIVSNSPKLICTAFLVDDTNNPPTSMLSLKVIKKATQKGE